MYKRFYKVFLWTLVIALLFSVFSFSVSEGEEWTCPNCGRGGLMKNFCPSCGTARPKNLGIPFEFKIGDIVAFSSQENANDTANRFIWTVADIDGKVVTLVCISALPETVVSLMDSETPEDAADFVKYVLIRKVLSEKEIAVIGDTGDFEVSDCVAFTDLLIRKEDKYLVLKIESNKIAPFLILMEYAEKSMDEADTAATESPTVTPTLKSATATPNVQSTATPTVKPATATPTVKSATATPTVQPTATVTPKVQPTATATPVVTPTPTATQPAAYGHCHSDLGKLKPWNKDGIEGHARQCNVCGELVGFATHTLPEEWALNYAPTCIAQGREIKKCSVCGWATYNLLEPTGVHDLREYRPTIKDGISGHGRYCTLCKSLIGFETHTLSEEGTLKYAPGCTTQGLEIKVCTICGVEQNNWLKSTGVHDLGELKPFNKDGINGHARQCKVCGYWIGFETCTLPEEWTLAYAPTCTTSGLEIKECTVCGWQMHNWLKPTGVHDLGELGSFSINGISGHARQCSVCMKPIGFETHTYPEEWTLEYAPSCISKGKEKKVCTVCGAWTYNWLDPTGHHYVDGFCSACGEKEP